MRYRNNLPLVLKDVSFTIRPKEKVGIVGRTGSGKYTRFCASTRISVYVCVITTVVFVVSSRNITQYESAVESLSFG